MRISSCTARKQTTPHLLADSATGLFALWKPHSASSGRRLVSFITHIVICIWINAMEKAKHRWANGCISPQMKKNSQLAGSKRACQLAIFRGGFDAYVICLYRCRLCFLLCTNSAFELLNDGIRRNHPDCRAKGQHPDQDLLFIPGFVP